jgi:hypothetical protein
MTEAGKILDIARPQNSGGVERASRWLLRYPGDQEASEGRLRGSGDPPSAPTVACSGSQVEFGHVSVKIVNTPS